MWYALGRAWPGGWPGRLTAAGDRRPPADVWILTRMEHPSFCPDVADHLVQALTARQARRLWTKTGAQLASPLPECTRLHVVQLREALLRRLEELDPAAVDRCAGGRRRPLSARRAARRS